MVVIVDYGVGNLHSIKNMIGKIGGQATISSSVSDIELASHIILPGMGAFDNCMLRFNASGLRNIIERKIFDEKVPLLGICVGLQMMMHSSEEGREAGLGWIAGDTVRFDKLKLPESLKIPHMGWLDLRIGQKGPMTKNLEECRFYFAHSYHVKPADPQTILFEGTYGYPFAAALIQNNIVGVQFHPEKSHRYGITLLSNFLNNSTL